MAHQLKVPASMPEGSSLIPRSYRIGRREPTPTDCPLNLMSTVWLKHTPPHSRPQICVHTLNKQIEMQLKFLSKRKKMWTDLFWNMPSKFSCQSQGCLLAISRLPKKQLCSRHHCIQYVYIISASTPEHKWNHPKSAFYFRLSSSFPAANWVFHISWDGR